MLKNDSLVTINNNITTLISKQTETNTKLDAVIAALNVGI